MKRKIQHDAVNNQEDEDSSAYPLYFLHDESSEKKKKIEKTTGHFIKEVSGTRIDRLAKKNP